MLVLRRTYGQSIAIGKDAEIIIKVLKNEDGIISIGVDAPTHVRIDRLERFKQFLINSQPKQTEEDMLLERIQQFQTCSIDLST